MSDFSFIPPTSVVTIPGAHASAAFTAKTSEVFKEEHNIAPIIINDKMKYIPWGGDNQMPYNSQSGGHRAHRTSQSTVAIHRPSEQGEENQEVRCHQPYSYARQYILPNTVLRSFIQRKVVQHQATHRHR